MLSGNKVYNTSIIRSATPTWNQAIHLLVPYPDTKRSNPEYCSSRACRIGEPHSVISFRLECIRGKLCSVLVVGSLNLSSTDLLSQCEGGRGEPVSPCSSSGGFIHQQKITLETTLLLLDNRRRHAGSLVVRVQGDTHSRCAVGMTESHAGGSVEGQGLTVPHPPLELARTSANQRYPDEL